MRYLWTKKINTALTLPTLPCLEINILKSSHGLLTFIIAIHLFEFIEKEEAKQRQAENAKRNQPQSQNVENLPPLENKGKSRDKIGELTSSS